MKRTLVSFDWAMKGILRDKTNFVALSGLLTELLGKNIVVYEIVESESNSDNKDGKTNRLDLKAKINNGEFAIFELQVDKERDFFHRILFGTSKTVVEQIHKGEDFENIKKIYSIAIVYFELGKGSDYIYHGTTDFKGLHNNETLVLSEKEMKFLPQPVLENQSAGVLFPEYYLIYPNRFNDDVKNKIDEWIHAFKTSEVESHFTAAGIQEFGEALDIRKMSDQERIAYEDFLKHERVRSNEITTAKADGYTEGHAEGHAEGMAKVFELLEKGVPLAEARKRLGIN